jgi:hypothetical protein
MGYVMNEKMNEKGLAVKLIFWIMLFLFVCILITAFLMFVAPKALNVTIFNQSMRHVQETYDVDIAIKNTTVFDSSGRETSEIEKGLSSTPFKITAEIEIPENSRVKKGGEDIAISISGYQRGTDFEGCRMVKNLKPGDRIVVSTDDPACRGLSIKPDWAGNVIAKITAARGDEILANGYVDFNVVIRLSSFGDSNTAICNLINDFDKYPGGAFDVKNDLSDITMGKNYIPENVLGFEPKKTILTTNNVECRKAVLECMAQFNLHCDNLIIIPDIRILENIVLKKGATFSINKQVVDGEQSYYTTNGEQLPYMPFFIKIL